MLASKANKYTGSNPGEVGYYHALLSTRKQGAIDGQRLRSPSGEMGTIKPSWNDGEKVWLGTFIGSTPPTCSVLIYPVDKR